jgi:hypothetical protein
MATTMRQIQIIPRALFNPACNLLALLNFCATVVGTLEHHLGTHHSDRAGLNWASPWQHLMVQTSGGVGRLQTSSD